MAMLFNVKFQKINTKPISILDADIYREYTIVICPEAWTWKPGYTIYYKNGLWISKEDGHTLDISSSKSVFYKNVMVVES
jgi:hypothetical protein